MTVNPMDDPRISVALMDGFVAPIFGSSAAMCVVLEQVARAATTRDHILISGEPGTGREMVAREIHRRSPGGNAGFAKVDCTVRPLHDLEVELFGCTNAAVDAANGDDAGGLERIARGSRLYQALGGSLFFEHLTQMPARVQARLARVLRGGQVVVLPQRETVGLNLRAIASVEQDYEQAVEEGQVRDSLHRLLSAIRISLLPLRNRREDIPALAAGFVEEYCKRSKVSAKTLSDSAKQLLAALPWHGNGTELGGLLEGLVHRVRTEVIQLRDVLNAIEIEAHARPSVAARTLREARAAFEREYILAVLLQHHGRIPEAARTLGIQRTNLYRKLKRIRRPPTHAPARDL